jgi:DNA-binding TFAR19-related protein (PDSD5 family)
MGRPKKIKDMDDDELEEIVEESGPEQQGQAPPDINAERAAIATEESGEGYGQFQRDEFISEDEARARIATMLISKDNIEQMSELTDYEIFKLSVVSAIARQYSMPLVLNWSERLLSLKVSRARAGRHEIKDVASPQPKQHEKAGLRDLILGGRML